MNDFIEYIFDMIFDGTENLDPNLMAMIPFFVLMIVYLLGTIMAYVTRKRKDGKKK